MRFAPRRARLGVFAVTLAFLAPMLASHPASAERKKSKRKSLASCTTVDQTDRADEDGLDFAMGNSCGIPVTCSIKWTTVCAPDVAKRRSTRSDSASFRIDDAGSATSSAIASCGADGWQIRDISWACEPAKD